MLYNQQPQQQQQLIDSSISLRCPSASSSISTVSPTPSSDSGHSTSPLPSDYLNTPSYNGHKSSYSQYYKNSTPFNTTAHYKNEPYGQNDMNHHHHGYTNYQDYQHMSQYYHANKYYNYANSTFNDSNYHSRNVSYDLTSSYLRLQSNINESKPNLGPQIAPKVDSLKFFSIDAILGRKEEKKVVTCNETQFRLPDKQQANETNDDLNSQSIDKRKRKNKSSINDANSNKRIRTIFTPEQLEKLEEEFMRQQYMVGSERSYLATTLNLTESQVKIWFQNRRIKWRKTNVDENNLTCNTDVNEVNGNDSNLQSPSNQSYDSSYD